MTKILGQLTLQEKTRAEILRRSELIPPLPELVVRLLAVLAKPETEPQHLETLLQNDQVLVAKMMAMVNSPFYGLNRPIRTVKEAVMVLGFRGVRSLVLASSTAKFLQRDYSCHGHAPMGLWFHAACVAAGARSLAKLCRLGDELAEQLFVAGLLHDIGKLMLVQHLGKHQQTAASASSIPGFERTMLGLDHTEAGALVVARWNLGVEVAAVIKAHHDDTADQPNRSIAVVRLADAVAHERGIGYLPGRSPAANVLAADLAALSLSPEAWSVLRAEVSTTMENALAALTSMGF